MDKNDPAPMPRRPAGWHGKILPASPDDVQRVLGFIHELAAYERLSHQLETSAERLHQHLFGPQPVCEAMLAWTGDSGAAVGFALCFTSYSTFKTMPCLHLEDLYVQPAWRGQGFGKALLQAVAWRARERGCARLEWVVLDWNEPAIGFYEGLGATVLPDWRTCRVEGAGIARLAAGAGGDTGVHVGTSSSS